MEDKKQVFINMRDKVLSFFHAIKNDRKKLIICSVIGLIIVVIGVLWMVPANHLSKVKSYYEQGNVEAISELKEKMNSEDWAEFEDFLLDEGFRVAKDCRDGLISLEDAGNELDKIIEISTISSTKNRLTSNFKGVEESKLAFEKGLKLKEAGDVQEAYKQFRLVDETDCNYEEAKNYIDELKPQMSEVSIQQAATEYENGDYASALKIIEEALFIDNKNEDLINLKQQYKEAKAEADRLEKEQVEAAKELTTGKMIEKENAEIKYLDAKLTTEILPDDTSGVYTYHYTNSDEIYLDLRFSIKNTGKFNLKLEGLVSDVQAIYADGYTYRTHELAWIKEPTRVTSVSSWDCDLEPLKTTTYHLAVRLPYEVANSDESLTVTFKMAGQEQILKFR